MAGKRYKAAVASYDKTSEHSVADAVKIVKDNAKVKFDETVELAINLGVDPRHADQMVRGVCNLPNGTGRSVRVAVFAKDAKAEEAKKAGADVVGADDLAEQIQKGDMPFERVIATPDMMPLVGRLGKVLGPKGMMPNPKVGTVTMDVAKAVSDAKGGAVEFRVEKAGIIHAGVGKASFAQECQCIPHRDCQGSPIRRQRHIYEENYAEFHDGTGRENRYLRGFNLGVKEFEARQLALTPERPQAFRAVQDYRCHQFRWLNLRYRQSKTDFPAEAGRSVRALGQKTVRRCPRVSASTWKSRTWGVAHNRETANGPYSKRGSR